MRVQTVRSRTVQAGLAGLLCLTLATAAIRVASSDSARDSDIVLTGASAVRVTDADGVVRDVTEGARLRRDDQVTTSQGGTATLVVDGRRLVLAPSTSVVVRDGVTFELGGGSVLVDRRRGPGLELAAGDVVLDEFARGGVRVDRSYSVRVSVYSGRVRARTGTGRTADVPPLRTLGVAGRSLPSPLPLALDGSPWEREIIPSVVDSDEVLNRLARGIDTSGPPTIVNVSVAPGAQPSEALLPVAIGRASRTGNRVAQATALRADGGSWGVVAAILDAAAGEVAARLNGLLSPGGGGTAAGPTGADGGPGPQPTGSGPGASPAPGTSRSPQPSQSGRPPTSSPPTSPSQTPNPVDELVENVSELVPSPTGTPPPGLLGGLLG